MRAIAGVSTAKRWIVPLAIGASALMLADVASDLARSALSPYEIARFVETHQAFDWTPLWKALKLTDDTGLPACEERRDDGSDCSSELIGVLDPEQTIVLLRHKLSGFEVYLRFTPEKLSNGSSGWRFTGHYQPNVKYFPPRHQIIQFGKRPYLTVTEQGAAGSGLSTEVESWVDLTQPSLQPVFWYTTDGSMNPFPSGISRQVHGTIVALESEPAESIKVAYSIDFSFEDANGATLPLGQRRDQAVYTRRPADGEFALDDKLSGVSLKQINNLYEDLDSELTNEDFLRYDFASLKEIASGSETRQKGWLRQFLGRCQETNEKQQLRLALQTGLPVPQAK